jgi:hypothetical protein
MNGTVHFFSDPESLRMFMVNHTDLKFYGIGEKGLSTIGEHSNKGDPCEEKYRFVMTKNKGEKRILPINKTFTIALKDNQ